MITYNDLSIHKTNNVKFFENKVTISEKDQVASYLVAEIIAQKLKDTLMLRA
jgi:hypothetical protein